MSDTSPESAWWKEPWAALIVPCSLLSLLLALALTPVITVVVRSGPLYEGVVSAGGAIGRLLPRGRWDSGGPVAALGATRLLGSEETDWQSNLNMASCIPGGGWENLVTPLSVLAAALLTLPVMMLAHRAPGHRDAKPTGWWVYARACLIAPFLGLAIGAAELCVRIFWTSAEGAIRTRSLRHVLAGDVLHGGRIAGGEGWVLEHGSVLAMGSLSLWLIRAGVWGLALLGALALAGRGPARRRPVALGWAVACVILLASPWWLAYFIGPLWIE